MPQRNSRGGPGWLREMLPCRRLDRPGVDRGGFSMPSRLGVRRGLTDYARPPDPFILHFPTNTLLSTASAVVGRPWQDRGISRGRRGSRAPLAWTSPCNPSLCSPQGLRPLPLHLKDRGPSLYGLSTEPPRRDLSTSLSQAYRHLLRRDPAITSGPFPRDTPHSSSPT
jgi:hypothetical protein